MPRRQPPAPAHLAANLAARGYAVVDDFAGVDAARELRAQLHTLYSDVLSLSSVPSARRDWKCFEKLSK